MAYTLATFSIILACVTFIAGVWFDKLAEQHKNISIKSWMKYKEISLILYATYMLSLGLLALCVEHGW